MAKKSGELALLHALLALGQMPATQILEAIDDGAEEFSSALGIVACGVC